MGLMHGSAGFTRYMAEGTLPQNFMEGLSENMARYAFRDLDDKSMDERSAGWVNIMDMFDNRFAGIEFLKEPYIAMSLRIDERKIPPTALKQTPDRPKRRSEKRRTWSSFRKAGAPISRRP
jgi:hypothetical protein